MCIQCRLKNCNAPDKCREVTLLWLDGQYSQLIRISLCAWCMMYVCVDGSIWPTDAGLQNMASLVWQDSQEAWTGQSCMFKLSNGTHWALINPLSVDVSFPLKLKFDRNFVLLYPNLSTLNMLNCFKDYKRCIHIFNHSLVWHKYPDEILSGATQHVGPPTQSILCLLMFWRLAEPGYQQTWHWPNKVEYSILSMLRG